MVYKEYMIVNIPDNVAVRLQERLEKLLNAFGRRGAQVDSVEELAVKYIERKLESVEAREKNKNQNSGITWVDFRRIYFNEIYIRDKGRCQYCTQRLARDEATIDHILSPKRGGQNTVKNTCLSCYWCNNDKGILTDEEYYYKQLVNKSKGIEPPKP